jgi:uncharacterized integral membrane protein
MVDFPAGTENEQGSSGRHLNPRLARLVAILILVGAVAVLVVQNSRRVTLRFLFVTGHVGLIWIIVVCLVVGGVIGYLVGRRRRVRRRRRRPATD